MTRTGLFPRRHSRGKLSDGAPPPADAIVLFDGHDLSRGKAKKAQSKWKVQDGYMEVAPHTGGIETKETFGDFQLHVEWAEPAQVVGNSQERGNSGVFLQASTKCRCWIVTTTRRIPTDSAERFTGKRPRWSTLAATGEWQTYESFSARPASATTTT